MVERKYATRTGGWVGIAISWKALWQNTYLFVETDSLLPLITFHSRISAHTVLVSHVTTTKQSFRDLLFLIDVNRNPFLHYSFRQEASVHWDCCFISRSNDTMSPLLFPFKLLLIAIDLTVCFFLPCCIREKDLLFWSCQNVDGSLSPAIESFDTAFFLLFFICGSL